MCHVPFLYRFADDDQTDDGSDRHGDKKVKNVAFGRNFLLGLVTSASDSSLLSLRTYLICHGVLAAASPPKWLARLCLLSVAISTARCGP